MYQPHIVYGDRTSPFQVPVYTGNHEQEATTAAQLARAAASYGFSSLILLNQTHGTRGHLITQETDLASYQYRHQEGDFLICTIPHVAIGIATADCVPLMLVDAYHSVVAAVHVGWRGLAAGIIPSALTMLEQNCDTTREELVACIGPCARSCCYEVDASFRKQMPYALQESSLYRTNGQRTFFDLLSATTVALGNEGVPSNQISTSQNCCTICSPQYYSHRRAPAERQRQISCIGLV